MRLVKIWKCTGTIDILSGISIGGMDTELNIGGADNQIIKNPITKEPYLPGSSLKGKMRSQLEREQGSFVFKKESNNFEESPTTPCRCGRSECKICTIFGAHLNPGAISSPTRIIIRDATLSQKSRELIEQLPPESDYIETKTENIIKRDKGTADSPRFIERVAAGIDFDFEILLQIFENDKEDELKKTIERGIFLIENSYLGGSGSRGYGQVKFHYQWEEVGGVGN